MRAKSARMFSRAIYEKLKALVSSWEREERAKAKVASGALLGLAALAGLLICVGFVLWLMRRYLS